MGTGNDRIGIENFTGQDIVTAVGNGEFHIGIINHHQVSGNDLQFSCFIVEIIDTQVFCCTQIFPHGIIHLHLDGSSAGQRSVLRELHDHTGILVEVTLNHLTGSRSLRFCPGNLNIQVNILDFLCNIAALKPPGNALGNQIQGLVRTGNGIKRFLGQRGLAAVICRNIGIVIRLFQLLHKAGFGNRCSHIGNGIEQIELQHINAIRQSIYRIILAVSCLIIYIHTA